MFWKVCFQCDVQHAADLGSALEEHVLAVSWFESKDSKAWIVEAITTTKPIMEEFTKLLHGICEKLSIPLPSLVIEQIPDTDWLEATWRNFPPRQIGRYYVYGRHTTPAPPANAIQLEINAATAFGSGEHETTTACLLTLDDLATQGIRFQKPLDMGCGSGILAIAIAKTWHVPVIAADNDPESVKVTTNNAKLNQCAPLIHAYLSEGFTSNTVQEHGPYDLIIANILASPLIDMAPDFARALAPNGMVVLSGLLSRQMDEVTQAYEAVGLKLKSNRTINEWEALALGR